MKTDLLEDAVRIARAAGTLLKERLQTDFSVHYKGEVDIVTEVDRAAQDLIQDQILQKYPDHGILGEEDLDLHGASGYVWIIDPLDGTTNYAHRFPVFSVSIAVAFEGEALCGVVYNPMSEEIFQSVLGEGASLNACPIRVSGTDRLDRSLLGTGFPYNIRATTDTNLGYFGEFAVRTQGIRRCGSAALDLCFVAAGRLDGFWELNLKPWDIAAGALILREAGGKTTDFTGRPLGLDGSRVLATNGRIHDEMLQVIRGSSGEGQDRD
ncbi:MAG: inositol monophosphatase [bacterium]|nr:MAG: inositol monophosphatase [bacterium]